MSFTYGVEYGDCEHCGGAYWLDLYRPLGVKLCQYCWSTEEEIDSLVEEDEEDRDDMRLDVSLEDLDENMMGDVLR